MTRLVLSISVSSVVLAVGLYVAWVQSANFARAAELHHLAGESTWYARLADDLLVRTERMEFALRVQQNQVLEGRD